MDFNFIKIRCDAEKKLSPVVYINKITAYLNNNKRFTFYLIKCSLQSLQRFICIRTIFSFYLNLNLEVPKIKQAVIRFLI